MGRNDHGSRRRFLRRCGLLATVGTGAALGGCTGNGSPSAGESPTSDTATPDDGAPWPRRYYRWFPAPGDFGLERYRLTTVDLERVDVPENASGSPSRALALPLYVGEVTGLPPERMSLVAAIADPTARRQGLPGFVVEGSFDRAAVRPLDGATKAGTHRGYDLYRTAGADHPVAAFRPGSLAVATLRTPGDTTAIEAMVDARAGERPRYVESHDGLGEVADALGTGDGLQVSTNPPYERRQFEKHRPHLPGQVATGSAVDLGEGEWPATQAVAFESASAADADLVSEWVSRSPELGEPRESSVDGRVVTVSTTVTRSDDPPTTTGPSAPETTDSGESTGPKVEVVTKTGTVTDGGIGAVDVVLQKPPGAANAAVGEAVLDLSRSGGTHVVGLSESGAVSFQVLQDDDDSLTPTGYVLDSPKDQLVLTLDLTHPDLGGRPLDPGTRASVLLHVGSGGGNSIPLRVPNSLSGEESVTL